MKLPSLLALPPTVLLCAFSAAAEPQWPHNVPKHMKYFPEDEVYVKRSLNVQEKMRREQPVGVKKMSSDEGEMFMIDNWLFASDFQGAGKNRRAEVRSGERSNVTWRLEAPLRPVDEGLLLQSWLLRLRARDALMKRGFKCPEGTNDCSEIGAPDSCCSVGSSCISIPDNGLGPVGCCPSGQNCGGDISCDTDAGYSSCPDSPNGGCCLPGYSCLDVGCVVMTTSVTFVQAPTPTSGSRTSSLSTGVVVVPTTEPSFTSSSPSPTTLASQTCTTGWFSCPASVGGGCCQNGRTCTTGASCLGDDISNTMAPSAPARPTSDSRTTSAPPATSVTDSICPVGFYVCSAYYPSGCCRVGRDCHTTGSCILTASTTVINTNGAVIIAPSGASAATTAAGQGGSCPSAWYSCAADVGGDCCPDGFACGQQQCTATSGTSVSAKVAASMAAIPVTKSMWVVIAYVSGIGLAMTWL